MRGGESLTYKVGDPITELVVTCRDEAHHIKFEGVGDGECCSTGVTMAQQVREIYAVAQEEGIPLFLRPKIHPIDCGGERGQSCPCPLYPYHPLSVLLGCGGLGLYP